MFLNETHIASFPGNNISQYQKWIKSFIPIYQIQESQTSGVLYNVYIGQYGIYLSWKNLVNVLYWIYYCFKSEIFFICPIY